MNKSDPPRHRHDTKLWSLLPPKDTPYDLDNLSKSETEALVEALGDGFGNIFAEDSKPSQIPVDYQRGLLDHPFYVPNNLEYDPSGFDNPFWISANDDAPAPAETFPLGFDRRRLQVYFNNQYDRFVEHNRAADRQFRKSWEEFRHERNLPPYGAGGTFEENALRMLDRKLDEQGTAFALASMGLLYRKPWYELHALWFLSWIEGRTSLDGLGVTKFAGQLGRLIEQYYWRFRFEEVALSGVGARKGASAGGKAKAALHRSQHDAWQTAASKIWAHRPGLSKRAVGEQISRELGGRTGKHIARYIRPSGARK